LPIAGQAAYSTLVTGKAGRMIILGLMAATTAGYGLNGHNLISSYLGLGFYRTSDLPSSRVCW